LSKAGVETEEEEPEEDEEIDMDALLGELEDDDLPF
jgi:hypothetical protein